MSTPLADRELLNLQSRHRWTVAEYHRMGEVGLLNEDSRVELIDGEIIEMTPIGSSHGGNVNRLIRLFSRVIGDKAIVSAQNPVVLGGYSEPEPDIALLRWRADDYEQSHPHPEDVLLLIRNTIQLALDRRQFQVEVKRLRRTHPDARPARCVSRGLPALVGRVGST